jgi:hypothetical protein
MPRRSLRRRGKTCIPSATAASLGSDDLLAVNREVVKDLSCFIISNEGAYRNSKDEIFSAPSSLVFAFAVGSLGGTKWSRIT